MRLILVMIMMILLACGKGQAPLPGEILINEVLFNPVKDGYDYAEGYNNSNHDIDLNHIKIANRNSTGDIAGGKWVTKDTVSVPPEGYFVVTANEKWLRQHYNIPDKAIILQVSAMPSFPDDEGVVIFLNDQDSVIDELHYSEKWHFSLISDPSGVALERISLSAATQDKNNWASAAASVNYGTPGYRNSQFKEGSQTNDEINIPRLFSPDNDGVDDIALFQYKMKEPGFVVNVVIYDFSGRKVRYLVKNVSVGLSAQYKWDGLDEMDNVLPQGIYIVVTEMFNLKGKTKKSKNVITLARR